MKRREFVTLLGSAAAWPLAAQAQQPAMPVIGFLGSESPERWTNRLRGFHQGLGETGYVEGRNVAIDYRWADGQQDRFRALAADVVRRQVSVIAVPGSTIGALAAKAETATIPIVFATGGDPVRLGLVADLKRPGGNLTGVMNLNLNLAPARLKLLHELVPAASLIGLLVDPTVPNADAIVQDVQAAAGTLGLQIHVLHASSERDFDPAFASLVQMRAGALLIGTEGLFIRRHEQLAALTVRHAVPTMFQFREYVAAGGLISYGGSTTGNFRQVGVYTGRILKGAKPADLPVEQSTELELVLNLRTAKALGLAVPPALLAHANAVIE